MERNPESMSSGVIEGIAHRPRDGDAMGEAEECTVVPGRGIDCENRKPGKREITLLSAESWEKVCFDLDTDVPWHTRRANLLVRGMNLAGTIGRILAIGDVRIEIHGETRPCGLMDRQFEGLRAALEPAFRGGVYGSILVGGVVRVGALVHCLENDNPNSS